MHELAGTGRARTQVAAWHSRVGLGARHADGARLRAANGRLVIISLASVEMGVCKGHKQALVDVLARVLGDHQYNC